MKYYYLSILILLTAGCSNEPAEKPYTEGTPIGIGAISTRSDGTSEWRWQTNDRLTATVNGQTAVYTRTAADAWTCENDGFTLEALGEVAPGSITLTFGTEALTTDQTTAADYRVADYMTGTGELDFLTISGTLEHQHTDLVIEITEGSGWNTGEFESTMTDASELTVNVSPSGGPVSAYHDASTFRAVIPPANLPQGTGASLATLTFGSGDETPAYLKGKTATITYDNNTEAANLKGKRLTLTASLDIATTVTITGITIADYTYHVGGGELKP